MSSIAQRANARKQLRTQWTAYEIAYTLALQASGRPRAEKIVGAVIALKYINIDTGDAWPSVNPTLMADTGLSERTVQRALQGLDASRWMLIEWRGAQHLPNRYWLPEVFPGDEAGKGVRVPNQAGKGAKSGDQGCQIVQGRVPNQAAKGAKPGKKAAGFGTRQSESTAEDTPSQQPSQPQSLAGGSGSGCGTRGSGSGCGSGCEESPGGGSPRGGEAGLAGSAGGNGSRDEYNLPYEISGAWYALAREEKKLSVETLKQQFGEFRKYYRKLGKVVAKPEGAWRQWIRKYDPSRDRGSSSNDREPQYDLEYLDPEDLEAEPSEPEADGRLYEAESEPDGAYETLADLGDDPLSLRLVPGPPRPGNFGDRG
jgi:hypothetical protein